MKQPDSYDRYRQAQAEFFAHQEELDRTPTTARPVRVRRRRNRRGIGESSIVKAARILVDNGFTDALVDAIAMVRRARAKQAAARIVRPLDGR